jgi:2-desacetyl-2-hydroxyethyl bacteriochlorophyllide A dehydrogenase
MKAIRYYGIQDVRCEEIPKPDLLDDEVLIEIKYAGICGSDLHIYNKGMFVINIPETMGHEFVGEIVSVGKAIKKFSVGDSVIGNPMVPCQKCDSCKVGSYNTCDNLSFIGEISQGCFTEYLAMKEEKLVKVPDNQPLKPFVLTEPLAVVMNICKRANFMKEEKVAVLGAGPIGLLTIMVLKSLYGIESVTALDLSEERLRMAKAAGADVCLRDATKLDLDYDKIVDCAGVPQTFQIGVEHVRANGAFYVVSIFEKDFNFDVNAIVGKQLQIVGCNVYDFEDLEDAVKVISNKNIDPECLISHVFTLQDCDKGFKLLASGEKTASKVVFNPGKKN